MANFFSIRQDREINVEVLDGEIRAEIPSFAGIKQAYGSLEFHFSMGFSEDTARQVIAIYDAHDPTVLTLREQEIKGLDDAVIKAEDDLTEIKARLDRIEYYLRMKN